MKKYIGLILFAATILIAQFLMVKMIFKASEPNTVIINDCDTVYVPQPIDSAEVAVGYLRTNGVIPDEED